MLALLPLVKSVFTPLAKCALVPLGLPEAALATNAAIQNKIFGSRTKLVFLNEEIDDVRKLVKSVDDAGLLSKGVSETVENEIREQKGRFLGALAASLGSSSSGNMLVGKEVIRAGEEVIRTGEDF